MKIFISWSGDMSRSVAQVLHDWLPYFIQAVKPFLSSDINKGARWSDTLGQELDKTEFGIICITPYNVRAPWLNFESGALAKSVDRSRVAPFLFLVNPSELRGPLSQFQATTCEKEDIFNLLVSINEKLGAATQLEHGLLRATFDHWWEKFSKDLKEVLGQPVGENELGYPWLYTLGDLKRIELSSESKSILIISPTPEKDLKLSFVRDVVQANLKRGVNYTVMISESVEESVADEIDSIFSDHNGQLALRRIPRDEFQSLAVTHYLILDGDQGDGKLRVFLELPITVPDYWIEVNGVAALGFYRRFHSLLNKYRPPVA